MDVERAKSGLYIVNCMVTKCRVKQHAMIDSDKSSKSIPIYRITNAGTLKRGIVLSHPQCTRHVERS